MEAIGIVSTVLVALFALAAIVTLVMSLPDINRYRRLKRM